jgi:hypothetical protein
MGSLRGIFPRKLCRPMRRWLDEFSFYTRVVLTIGVVIIMTVLIVWL